jgi:hypothetical protein
MKSIKIRQIFTKSLLICAAAISAAFAPGQSIQLLRPMGNAPKFDLGIAKDSPGIYMASFSPDGAKNIVRKYDVGGSKIWEIRLETV